jgi:membrane-associated phospholipid phosphatase
MTAIRAFTDFGDLAVLLPLASLMLVWLFWKQSGIVALFWLGAVFFCTGLTALLKVYFFVCPPAADLHSPSGHTGFSTLVYGSLSVIAAMQWRGWRRSIMLVAGAIFVILIGLSRIALDAHTIAEVIFGFAIGGLSLAFFAVYYLRFRDPNITLGWLMLAALVLIGVFHGQQLRAEELLHAIGLDLHRDGMACVF